MNESLNKFGEYLQQQNESPYAFALRTNIAQMTVYKVLKGLPIRCDTVDKILEHTKGLKREDFNTIDYTFKEFA